MADAKEKSKPEPKPFFGEATSFQSVFPHVAKIRLTVREHGANQKFEPESYTETDLPAALHCRNPRCWLGGLRLKPFLKKVFADLQKQGKTAFEKAALCCGHEEAKTKPYRRCLHTFTIKGSVEFKKDKRQTGKIPVRPRPRFDEATGKHG
jgi:hypothetical protein